MVSASNSKIALVSGASRGIGEAIALQLAKNGMTVIGTATTQTGADHISAQFEQHQLNGKGYVLNVCQQESIDQLMETISRDMGDPIILVNNAAITRDNIMLRMKEEEWNSVIDTNLNSIYRLSKSCLKSMLKARWGRIINISSVVGFMGNLGQANYAAAKAGMVAFSKSLAQEVGSRGITVNVVAPGFIETDMTRDLSETQRGILLDRVPIKRLGQVGDIAAAVAFLASEEAGYITGTTLHVNGGMWMG